MTAVSSCDCGVCACCTGVEQRTPLLVQNDPGLSVIAYRIGTQPDFLASMLARLSSDDYPALNDLLTRDRQDFSIAILDAFASVADVLTFYQERIATESFLRTAEERRSLVELARLIDYRLRPGVAAETHLAFSLEEAPGAPRTLQLDAGIRVQSEPGPGEKPQIFETVEPVEARVDWNAIRPATTLVYLPENGHTDAYFAGVDLNLRAGDALLFLALPSTSAPADGAWQFRVIETAEIDVARGLTHVTWETPLAFTAMIVDPRVYALRRKAAVFGHNAPLYKSMSAEFKKEYESEDGTILAPIINFGGPIIDVGGPGDFGDMILGSIVEWPDYVISPENGSVDLDTTYPQIAVGSWLVMTRSGATGVFRVEGVSEVSRAEFAISAKVTRAKLNGSAYSQFKSYVRETTVYAVSEKLPLAERPVEVPVFGTKIALGRHVEGLRPGQALSFSGRRAHLRAATLLLFADASGDQPLRPGSTVEVLAPPLQFEGGGPKLPVEMEGVKDAALLSWQARNAAGSQGVVESSPTSLVLIAAPAGAETTSEIAFIDDAIDAVQDEGGRTVIRLKSALVGCYDPESLAINANVARATHGETVSQILGSGDAARVHQRFELKQFPLTFTAASNESGGTPALTVRVDDIAWTETPSLYPAGTEDRLYTLRIDDDAKATVQFGDGTRGARLPSGVENVLATYRKGLGAAGNIATGKLSQLITRPLGLKSVTNPAPAAGGTEPDGVDSARRNMPLSVRTLGRTVSLRDYEDYARAFSGIAKAQATVLGLRAGLSVFLTVAGENGEELTPGHPTLVRLVDAPRKAGDPSVRFETKAYRPASFGLSARIKADEARVEKDVLAAVETALLAAFSFDAREFGQPVTLSQVVAVIQSVQGVVGADLDALYRDGSGPLEPRLVAERAHADSSGSGIAAELLLLDPNQLDVKGGLL